MERLKDKFLKFRFNGILVITSVFALMAIFIFMERSGISYHFAHPQLELLSNEQIVTKDEANATLKKDTLVLYNSSKEDSMNAYQEFQVMFEDMKVGYVPQDVFENTTYDFNAYEKIVVLLSDLSPLKEDVITLASYVYEGGNVMFALTIEKTAYSSVIESMMGIEEASYDMTLVDSIYIEEGFMIGGGRRFDITDGYDSARALQLNTQNVKVYAYTGDDKKTPLIWKTSYGQGNFVVDNFGLCEKVMRGFFVASYTLLGDAAIYPVINGSTFYLDDFPSQIPSGDNEYITRDYGVSIRDFYVNIWWPDMMNIADQYNIKYTGLAIEGYDDHVDGTIEETADKGTFLKFGNMLLRKNGELGYHGYNHQPICLGNVDYKGFFDYKTWESYDAMEKTFDHLVDLCDELFPNIPISVYVPPSNILSQEGRNFLLKTYPQIKTISGIYFEDAEVEHSCVQEFDVSKDGIVDQPRIVSGCQLDNFMNLAVISELNFHFVNSHFTHPDDALDPDRGAEVGWENLKQSFNEYLSWLYTSAPTIRNFTSSEMSAATQRFVAISPSKTITEDEMTIELDHFYDEAQLLIRFNEVKPTGQVSGGKLTKITGDLYLLEATNSSVRIELE